MLTVVEASKICGVTRATVWRWIKSGQLSAAATAGGHHRIDENVLQEFMSKKKMHNQQRGHLSKKILIVDDDPSILRLLTRVLTHDNLEIATASNGFEAGIKTVKFKPHLIVLDLIMPKMDGFEVCSKIKNDPDTSDIKIIAMSGFNTDTNKGKILTMGADAFFPKPLEIKNFSKEVDQLLGIKQITLEKT